MSKQYTADSVSDQYTDDELAGLSEEERQAVTSAYEGDEPGDDDLGLEDDISPDTDTDPGTDTDKKDVADIGTVEDVVADESAAATTVEEPPVQEVTLRLPESIADQFKERLEALATKFYDGEIELGDMLDERDKINREIYNAEVELAEQTRAAQAWQKAQDAFFKANDVYLQDHKRYEDLNIFVKTVAAREVNASFADVLAKAARMEAAMNGAPAPAEGGNTAESVKADKGKKAQSQRPTAPNLADIPATSSNGTAGGEFTHMDSLTGMAYESALARMSEEQRERYLKS